MQTEDRVIVIAGPTAVGKTGTAMEVALRLGSEIVSADSMQVYRMMDIGTEKPTPEQRARVRHHLVDFLDPREGYSAGRFALEAGALIASLHARGLVPVVTGGTGLYIKALTRGLFEAPPADEALRAELSAEPADALYARLADLDPDAAAEVAPGDARRIVRALEVTITCGEPISALRNRLTRPVPGRFIKLCLMRDREELYAMIDQRVDEMFARGLVDEVRDLMAIGPDITPMQAIGYKELAAHLAGEYDLDEAVRLVKRNTRRYAKRQLTWFRAEDGMHWVDLTGVAGAAEAFERVRPVLAAGGMEI